MPSSSCVGSDVEGKEWVQRFWISAYIDCATSYCHTLLGLGLVVSTFRLHDLPSDDGISSLSHRLSSFPLISSRLTLPEDLSPLVSSNLPSIHDFYGGAPGHKVVTRR